MAKTPVKSAKRPVARKTTAKSKSKFSITNHRLFKPVLITLGVILFGGVGTYIIQHPFALDANGVPKDPTQLVIEVREAHSHPANPGVMAEYHPPTFLLYGDGVLICGDHAAKKSDSYTIKTGNLTQSQIGDLVDKVTKQGAKSKDESDNAQKLSSKIPIEATNEVLVNYNGGAVGLRNDSSGPMTTTYKQIRGTLTSACAKYAKEDYQPDQFVVRSQAVDADTTAELPDVTSDLTTTVTSTLGKVSTVVAGATDGSYTEQIVDNTKGNNLVKASKGARHAKKTANGKTYEIQVNPVMPPHSEIEIATPTDNSKVGAGSELTTKFIWFYPAGVTRSTAFSSLDNIHTAARSFMHQETNRINTPSGDVSIQGVHGPAWYSQCHSELGYTCQASDQKDLNSWNNVRIELENRGLIPKDTDLSTANVSINVLAQWPSQWGNNYCSGWGTAPRNPSVSRGGFALSTGFYSATGGCMAWTGGKYVVPTHEMGHTFGLQHDCSSSPNNALMCSNGSFTWPTGYTLTGTQNAALKAGSLFLNHQVLGHVYYKATGAPAAGLTVTTCRSDLGTVTTGSNGYFGFRLFTFGAYCARITAPAGYKIETPNNTPEHATATSYEYQRTGKYCYHQPVDDICDAGTTTWDTPGGDQNKDFALVKIQ